MKNKIRKILTMTLFLMVMSYSTIYASTQTEANIHTLEEAREYLINYKEINTNEYGKEYTVEYVFDSERDLNAAAKYILDYGVDTFNHILQEKIEESVSNEPKYPIARTTSPTTAYETISGDGSHYVSAQTYGLASFDTLGTVEYRAELGYRVVVENGEMVEINSVSFDIPYISAAGSWGSLSIPTYCTETNCGATANYIITKTIEIPIGDFSVQVKSETDNEIFALLTELFILEI